MMRYDEVGEGGLLSNDELIFFSQKVNTAVNFRGLNFTNALKFLLIFVQLVNETGKRLHIPLITLKQSDDWSDVFMKNDTTDSVL